MPQNVTADKTSTTPQDREVFAQALQIFNSEPQFAHLAKDLMVNVQLKQLEEGVGGKYFTDNGDIEISPTQSGRVSGVGDYLNTLTHELTHAAQHAHKLSPNEKSYRSPAGTALMSLQNPVAVEQKLTDAGFNYGANEPGAWIAANMTRGPQINRDIPVLKFIEANPEFSAEFFRRNAQPNRPVGTHKKGEPEMSLAEKVLYKFTGYAPDVKLDIPPWTKQDIARMNAQLNSTGSNKGKK